ncbi:unnamed protein product, partial [Mycena citricolor]
MAREFNLCLCQNLCTLWTPVVPANATVQGAENGLTFAQNKMDDQKVEIGWHRQPESEIESGGDTGNICYSRTWRKII